MSTNSGSSGGSLCTCGSPDMFDPVLVLVYFAADGSLIHLLDAPGDRSGPPVADHAVVDGLDRDHLGRGTGEKRLICDIQVGAQNVLGFYIEAQVVGDGDDRILGDALERPCGQRRGQQPAAPDDKKVLA